MAAAAGAPAERGAGPALGDGEEIPDLRALEERHIQRVLRLAGGNKSRAARLLGHQPPDAVPKAQCGTLSHCDN